MDCMSNISGAGITLPANRHRRLVMRSFLRKGTRPRSDAFIGRQVEKDEVMKALYLIVLCSTLIAVGPARSNTCGENLTYLSSSIDAYTYLENVQRELYEANPRLVHDPYLRERLNDPNSI